MPPVLWVDDEQFSGAEYLLKRDGWSITWKNGVAAAAAALHQEAFAGIILDMQMPGPGIERPLTVWSGYVLLCWVRGTSPVAQKGLAGQWEGLEHVVPLPENQVAPVVVVSAYHDEKVLKAIRNANLVSPTMPFLAKPLDIDALRQHLKNAFAMVSP
jgi:CheY-like chemotaxis protein